MSLKIEAERAVAQKLRSPIGHPLFKPRGKPHILFPYGAKYRSPNRFKWWIGQRPAYPHHSHQKNWLPASQLSIQSFLPQMQHQQLQPQQLVHLPPQQQQQQKEQQRQQMLEHQQQLMKELLQAQAAVCAAASAIRKPCRLGIRDTSSSDGSSSDTNNRDVSKRMLLSEWIYDPVGAAAQLQQRQLLPEALHALPLHGVGCLLFRDKRRSRKLLLEQLHLRHRKWQHSPKLTARGVVLPPKLRLNSNTSSSVCEATGEGTARAVPAASQPLELRRAMAFIPRDVYYRHRPFKARVLGDLTSIVSPRVSCSPTMGCVSTAQCSRGEADAHAADASEQGRDVSPTTETAKVQSPNLALASSSSASRKHHRGFVFRSCSSPANLSLDFWRVAPPLNGNRFIFRPSVRLS
ncbi:uncharacterized protein LOC113146666 [Cyclospora cayetanensis]|uniref:Uncharacterized protein LOC113146666 n=1 Tax=Cyclospora cayetanensis TaxID=88456 RepID=A0A6P6RSH4_9EIME|nr:uncharacterized protein LOC113146666 [Cyclospora cayetanensis]